MTRGRIESPTITTWITRANRSTPRCARCGRWSPIGRAGGRLRAAFDFHCPWIRGKHNEDFYFVGSKDPGNWERIQEFSRLLEAECSGGLPFESKHNLPYGQAWNTYEGPLVSFGRWAGTLPGLWLSASSETPYSHCGGVETLPERARTLGRDFARALRKFLENR